MKIVTPAQIRELERRTVDSGHLPARILMERPGLCVVELLRERFGPLHSRRVAVICGAGNNGGDGLTVARQLLSHGSAHVSVWLVGKPAELRGEAAASFESAVAFGVEIRPTSELNLSCSDWVIDALFGTGMKGAVVGENARLIEQIHQSGKPVVAVEFPSGLNAETGTALRAAVRASITVTRGLPKHGLLPYPGESFVGELVTADIGLLSSAADSPTLSSFLTEAADIARWSLRI